MADITVTCPNCDALVLFPVRVDAHPEPGALRISVSVDEDVIARVVEDHIDKAIHRNNTEVWAESRRIRSR